MISFPISIMQLWPLSKLDYAYAIQDYISKMYCVYQHYLFHAK